jgi:hypothetical protein
MTPISSTSPGKSFSISHWRKRLGDKLELLLAESLRVAHASGVLRSQDLKRVTVDTTVQPKNISFPTDAKLLHAAIRGGDAGGALRPCQAVQPPSPGTAHPADAA